MIQVTITGDKELAAALDRITEPSRQRAIVQGAMLRGMTVMVRTIKALVPPATTRGVRKDTGQPHDTKKMQQAIGRRFGKDKVTYQQMAKVGVAVGMGRSKLVAGKKTPVGRQAVPHAHLYFAGTVNRYTGEKLDRSGPRTAVVRSADGSRMRVKKAKRYEKTGNPRKFRGRMPARTTVTQGVERSWPLAMQVMQTAVYDAVQREFGGARP